MRTSEYRKAVAEYDLDLERLCVSYKNDYSDAERRDIFKLCRKISRANIPSCDVINILTGDGLRSFFLRSLNALENPKIIDYFSDKTNKIKLIRDKRYSYEEELSYEKKSGESTTFKLRISPSAPTLGEQMGYSHEIGHIPEIDYPRESFLEYSEALPIFMEYLTLLEQYKDKDKAFDYFLLDRLPMEQEEARDIMKIFKRIENKNETIRLYYTQLFADYYKYIESLEYAIQLIKMMSSDTRAVADEIEEITNGRSLVKTAENLDIVTDGCINLQKEYKRMSR